MDTVSHSDAAWSGLNALIEKRDRRRVKEEGERPAEEMYAESCRAFEARRRLEIRAAWYGYYMDQAERIERTAAELAAEHRARVAVLCNGDRGEGGR